MDLRNFRHHIISVYSETTPTSPSSKKYASYRERRKIARLWTGRASGNAIVVTENAIRGSSPITAQLSSGFGTQISYRDRINGTKHYISLNISVFVIGASR
jgi:hypothetical protein